MAGMDAQTAAGGQLRLAVLIDADNAAAAVIDAVLREVASVGEATVRRIYGDFTSPASAKWRAVLQRHAIKPIQQFAHATGKNATDSALIIDAMDLLYTGRFDGFCLVTSDSDFTGLATRLREAGLMVLGFGEEKTPDAFRNACHRFVRTEVLKAGGSQSNPARVDAKPTVGPSAKDLPQSFLLAALAQSADDSGWAQLSTFGSYVTKLQPDFDARLYGYAKLSDLVRGNPKVFRLEERPGAAGHKHIWVAQR